ncbi:MAG: DNA adenine methylase, partial [Ignavibacteriaceae bacterium]|nr:DNA adenine methylase [Ignavibacteriaceae bacterium]
MIKSPLRYPGGKSRAIDSISRLVPDFKEFREPFVGGGSVFIHLKQKFPRKDFWINDIYKNLFHFWNECKENPKVLIDSILELRVKYPDGKELYRFLSNNIDSFDSIKKATAFFIFNRITFSGTTESGGFSNAAFQKRFTQSSIERVKSLSNILVNTKISNYDYEEVVSKEGEDVFLFLDPPYYSATKSALYGKNGTLHKTFDHERFANVMKGTKHKWLITYDDSDYIKNLFSFANILP